MGRKEGGSPSSLAVHALERQESSAPLQLYILLEGEGEPLQPCADLLHPPPPAGAAASGSSPCSWTLYSSSEALKGPGSGAFHHPDDSQPILPEHSWPGGGPSRLSLPPAAGAGTPTHTPPTERRGRSLLAPQHARSRCRRNQSCVHTFEVKTQLQVSCEESQKPAPARRPPMLGFTGAQEPDGVGAGRGVRREGGPCLPPSLPSGPAHAAPGTPDLPPRA